MNRNPSDESILTSRRALLKAAGGCGVMTNTSLMATLLNLQATKAMMAAESTPTDYKAIVCLFLLGGNDSYNMLVPAGGEIGTESEYGLYHKIRGEVYDPLTNPGGLALAKDEMIPIVGPNGRPFGLHPGMGSEFNKTAASPPAPTTGAAKLYADGNLAFVANVGSLLEKTTLSTYKTRTKLPLGLFSHADLQRHWQTGTPDTRSKITGWGGRMADLLAATNSNDFVSMNISLGGTNLFQTGGNTVPYAIGTGGANAVSDYSPGLTSSDRQRLMYSRAINGMFPAGAGEVEAAYSDLLARSFARSVRGSTDAALEFNAAVNAVSLNTDNYANESPSNQLKMVARAIGARNTLGQKRQIFFVSIGGWDNHNNLITAHNNNLPRISRALKSFYDSMVDLGVENDVTLFTASDFARTLTSNGQGSDHAWGGNQIVMGGGVDGGKIYGDYPLMWGKNDAQNVLNVGSGRLIPTTSVDEMAAEMALWFGVGDNASLEDILPNVRRFYEAGNQSQRLGFLPV